MLTFSKFLKGQDALGDLFQNSKIADFVLINKICVSGVQGYKKNFAFQRIPPSGYMVLFG